MLKNRFLAAFALAGLIGFAACEADEPEVIEEPVVEEPAVAPVVEPAPVITDTAVVAPAVTDTAVM